MTSCKRKRVPLIGYTNRLSARPGDTIDFKLSAETAVADNHQAIRHDNDASEQGADDDIAAGTLIHARLAQCISADPNPAGPGMVELSADQWFTPMEVTIGPQDFQPGSYGISDIDGALSGASAITLEATVWPTLNTGSIQSIISIGALSLCISTDNTAGVLLGKTLITGDTPLTSRAWAHISVEVKRKLDSIAVTLQWQSADQFPSRTSPGTRRQHLDSGPFDQVCQSGNTVIVAAQRVDNRATHFFNGKIESPAICIQSHEKSTDTSTRRSIAWDFSKDMSSRTVPGSTHTSPPLTLINHPARAMTGSRWKGQEMSWRHAPDLYGAIHFHEDDIVDFDWKTSFSWTVPEGMPSGIYIMHISDGINEDAMPLYVCAPKKKPGNRLCLLIPTFTYAIYGNHARPDWEPSWKDKINDWKAYPHNPAEYPEYGLSTYNYHSDGSGICHASHLRPLFNLRPGYITFGNTRCSGLRHFQADSHLSAWLDAHELGFDVITDRELHEEGYAAIAPYAIVMTTSHPEYHTAETLDALLHYRDSGGHLSYLGGNGFYWRIALHAEHSDVLEIRRAEDGIRAWAAEPGEYYHAFDGQYGGLWRRNGRPPQVLCGLGFSAQGQFNGSYYRRRPVGRELAWIFDGIDDEILGDFGLCGGGAAGFELDRADVHLGTPADATVIASSENHGDDFILVPEEMLTHLTTLPGAKPAELLRADILWFDVPGGGSVFSVGSITFCGSLPHDEFKNSISRLLFNVVTHVLAD